MTTPISPDEFSTLMERLAPFEPAPHVAVAVSGGADSMALALLALSWARQRGGEAVALTVDHGLRPESAAEALVVGAWLAGHGMAHHILRWQGDKPVADLQARARAARYGLLGQWCRAAGVLHCLLAHHCEDQAETLLLRLGRGSGVDGLAAMAPVQTENFGRWLRPLLVVEKERLRATLRARGQDWVEDPSNRKEIFSRVRLRALMPALAEEGLRSERLAHTARRLGRARAALEQATAAAAARFVALHPGGFALVEPQAFARLPEEVGLRLMVRLLLAVSGGIYAPREEHSDSLYEALRQGLSSARTLAGCGVISQAQGILFCREASRVEARKALVSGAETLWDGRFRLHVPDDARPGLWVGALGVTGWRDIGRSMAPVRPFAIPAPVRATLPAIYDEDGIFAVPHLGYKRCMDAERVVGWIVAAPSMPLTVASRRLV